MNTVARTANLPVFSPRSRCSTPGADRTFEIHLETGTHKKSTPSADYETGYNVLLKEGAPVRDLVLPLGRDLGGVVMTFALNVPRGKLEAATYVDELSKLEKAIQEAAQDPSSLRGDKSLVTDFRDDTAANANSSRRADPLVHAHGVRHVHKHVNRPAIGSDWSVGIYRRTVDQIVNQYILVVKFYSFTAGPAIDKVLDSSLTDITRAFRVQSANAQDEAKSVADAFLELVNRRAGPAVRISYARQPIISSIVINSIEELPRKTTTGFTHVLRVGTVATGAVGDRSISRTPVLLGKSQGVVLFRHKGTQFGRPISVPICAPPMVEGIAETSSAAMDNAAAFQTGHLGLPHWVGARCPRTVSPVINRDVWDVIYGNQFHTDDIDDAVQVYVPMGQIGPAASSAHLSLLQQARMEHGGMLPDESGDHSAAFASVPHMAPPAEIRRRLTAAVAAEGKTVCENIYHSRQAKNPMKVFLEAMLAPSSTVTELAFEAGEDPSITGAEGLYMEDVATMTVYSRSPTGPSLTLVEVKDPRKFLGIVLAQDRAVLDAYLDNRGPPPRAILSMEENLYM